MTRPADKNADRAARKLRRNRTFAAHESDILSAIPTLAMPHARRYRAASGCASPAAAPSPALEAAIDRIICGDSASILKDLPDSWCALAITSPPYWHTVDYGVPGQIGLTSYAAYLDELDRVWAEIARILLPNGKFCLNVPLLPLTKDISDAAFGPSHTRILLDLYADMKRRIEEKTPLRLFSLYVWEKQTTEKMFGSYPFPPNLYERNYVEFIAVFVKPGSPRVLPAAVKEASRLTQAEWIDLTQQVWWIYPENVPRLEGHPAPFPEALPNRLIAMYSFRGVPELGFDGDIVLDPFIGSGTTAVAARRLGRRFVGIDLNRDFCAFAQERVAATPLAPRVMRAKRPGARTPTQQSPLGT